MHTDGGRARCLLRDAVLLGLGHDEVKTSGDLDATAERMVNKIVLAGVRTCAHVRVCLGVCKKYSACDARVLARRPPS